MSLRKVALVCVGGFCGTLARYLLAAPLLGLAGMFFPSGTSGFPFDIFAINLSGAFALGLLYGLVERGANLSPNVRLAVGTGFLGAYTTFSTFVYGGDRLLAAGTYLPGMLYLCGSVALGVGCAWAGQMAASAIGRYGRALYFPSWISVKVAQVRQRSSGAGLSRHAGSHQPPENPHPGWWLDTADDDTVADTACEEEEVSR